MYRLLLIVLVGVCLVAPSWADEGAASPLEVFMLGGPPAADLELHLNGAYLATVVPGSPPSIELGDLVKPGLNELKVTIVAPTDERRPRRTQLIVAPLTKIDPTRSEIGDPVAVFAVPMHAPEAAGCSETLRFWAGPLSIESEALKNEYYLATGGPAASHRVTVMVNGYPALSTNRPTNLRRVNDFLAKGKNTVIFEMEPVCTYEKSGSEHWLQFSVARGTLEYDTVSMEKASIIFNLNPRKKQKSSKKKYSFRAF